MEQAETILAFVMRKLNASRGRLVEISRASGVPYHTLTKIAQGQVENPRIATVQRLVDHFSPPPTDPAASPSVNESVEAKAA